MLLILISLSKDLIQIIWDSNGWQVASCFRFCVAGVLLIEDLPSAGRIIELQIKMSFNIFGKVQASLSHDLEECPLQLEL